MIIWTLEEQKVLHPISVFTDLRFIIVSLWGKAIKEYIIESIEVIPIALTLVDSLYAKAVA